MNNKFGITYFSAIHPEMEICRRIEVAAKNIGISCFFINKNGICLQNGKHVSELDLDFVIIYDPSHMTFFNTFVYHLHWFVPGLIPIYYENIYNQLSDNCDDHLCFPSEKLNKIFRNHYEHINNNYLFPSVPRNYVLKPKEFLGTKDSQYKVFYAGINVDNNTVRYEKLFRFLDEKGIVSLYGPKIINDKENWVGFSSYKGEIAFDGHSMIDVAHEAGITLAIHHAAHKIFSMPTNRAFEGFASGNLVITEKTSFFEQNFKDSIFMLNDDFTEEQKAKEILRIVNWANSHPKEALRKAQDAQQIFLEKFELTNVISNIYKQHNGRKLYLFDESISNCKNLSITIIVEVYDETFKNQFEDLMNQDYTNIELLFIIFNQLSNENSRLLAILEKKFCASRIVVKINKSYADANEFNRLQIIKNYVKTDTFCFSVPLQRWHHNHIRLSLEKLARSNSSVVYSGSYHTDENGWQASYVSNNISNLEEMFLQPFATNISNLYDLLQTQLAKSQLIFKRDLLSLISDDEINVLVSYEHLALTLIAFAYNCKVSYSGKLSLYFEKLIDCNYVENNQSFYYHPVRLNEKMGSFSMHFILSEAFYRNSKVMDYINSKLVRELCQNIPFADSTLLMQQKINKLQKKFKKYRKIFIGILFIILIQLFLHLLSFFG